MVSRLVRKFLSPRDRREVAELEHPSHHRTDLSPFAEARVADAAVDAHREDMRDCMFCLEPGADKRCDPIGDPFPNFDDTMGTPVGAPGPNAPELDVGETPVGRPGRDPVEDELGLLDDPL